MSLVPTYNDEIQATQLKCFFPGCGYSIIPGLEFYKKMIEELDKV